MTGPAVPGDDDLRGLLADALAYRPGSSAYDYADALLPVVRAYADQRAAEELRRMAEEMEAQGDQEPEDSVGAGYYFAADRARLRATALTSKGERP